MHNKYKYDMINYYNVKFVNRAVYIVDITALNIIISILKQSVTQL